MKARELKFRVWVTHFGNAEPASEMYYIPNLQLHIYFGNWERGGYKNAVFQQFTGIKDCNGREIYEGDIVKTTTHPSIFSLFQEMPEYTRGEIKWLREGFEICEPGTGATRLSDYVECDCHNCMSLEVIGNIFDKKN